MSLKITQKNYKFHCSKMCVFFPPILNVNFAIQLQVLPMFMLSKDTFYDVCIAYSVAAVKNAKTKSIFSDNPSIKHFSAYYSTP